MWGLGLRVSRNKGVFAPHHAAAQRTLKFQNFRKKKGFEQSIGVAEALAGLHTWISWAGVQDDVYKAFASASI